MIRSILAVAALGVAGVSSAQTIYGLDLANTLKVFQASTPGTISASIPITGLASDEIMLGIDTRATNAELFGISNTSTMYRINKTTGAATAVGAVGALGLSGEPFGMDFNPTVDRIRYVDAGAGNRRFNPVTGGVAANDASLTYAGSQTTPRAVGVAYTNAKLGGVPAGSVREYIIDSRNDSLGEVGSMAGGNASFNAGVTTVVGSLGVDTNDLVGFDIDGNSGIFYASLTDTNSNFTSLYTINSASGSASLVGAIGNGQVTLRDITVVPEPASLSALALGSLLLGRRRK